MNLTGIAVPLGWPLPSDLMSCSRMLGKDLRIDRVQTH